MLTDSHAHLDGFRGEAEVEAMLERARAAGVARMVAIGGHAAANEWAAEVAGRFPDAVAAAVGFDRDQAVSAPDADSLRPLLARPGVVALGEAGLDYHYSPGTAAAQRSLFGRMAVLSAETGRPLVVHTREADADTLAVLREHAAAWRGDPAAAAVLHCFTGSYALARSAIDLGALIGISGIVTFRNAGDLRETVKKLPVDRLLVETDTPYLSPVPLRGRPNEPAHLAHTAAALADLLGMPVERLAALTSQNAARLFRWPFCS